MSDELNPVPMQTGKKMHINMTEGSRPFKTLIARRVPLCFEEEANKTIEDLVTKGVITPVTETTDWCRYPVFNPDTSIDAPEPEQPEIVTCMRTTHDQGLNDISQYIDEDYNLIADVVESDQNWKKFSRQHPANQFKGIMHRLSLHRTGPDNQQKIILLDRTRIVIPKQARQYILKSLHTAHSGMTKTYKTARQLYYWPGMKANIAASIDACMACQSNKASLARPQLRHTVPSRAMTPMKHSYDANEIYCYGLV